MSIILLREDGSSFCIIITLFFKIRAFGLLGFSLFDSALHGLGFDHYSKIYMYASRFSTACRGQFEAPSDWLSN
jgi:hypothetical protein